MGLRRQHWIKLEKGKLGNRRGDVLFQVVFNVVTFKIFKGEVLEGVVHKMLKHGVFMRIGPIKNAYPSSSKMLGYMYILGENQISMNQKMPKIAKDVKVRVVVIGMKWVQAEREFEALVGLEGDYLGPISSPDM
jgi:DNA-directed RNA polymerase IV and V subunit 7